VGVSRLSLVAQGEVRGCFFPLPLQDGVKGAGDGKLSPDVDGLILSLPQQQRGGDRGDWDSPYTDEPSGNGTNDAGSGGCRICCFPPPSAFFWGKMATLALERVKVGTRVGGRGEEVSTKAKYSPSEDSSMPFLQHSSKSLSLRSRGVFFFALSVVQGMVGEADGESFEQRWRRAGRVLGES
jgi:hypothetical protein